MKILGIIIPSSDRHGDKHFHLPLGMLSILASIRDAFPHANLKVLDFAISQIDETTAKSEIDKINDFIPDYICFGGMVTRYRYIKMLSKLCRSHFPNAVQICGGTVSLTGNKPLSANSTIDIFVVGEGEETIVEILQEKKLQEISGICINSPYGSLRQTSVRSRIKDLDAIPRPAYDLVDTQKYITLYQNQTGWRYLPLVVTRGCPFNCNFCLLNFGHEMTYRSPKSVIEELNHLKINYGIDSFTLWDDIQFVDKKWVREFAERLIKEKLNLKWSCVSRVSLFPKKNHDEDLELLKLCKKSGLLRVSLGIESGNQKMLDAMNKRITVPQTEYCISLLRKAGIKASGSMLVGYPGENKKTIQDSVDFVRRNLLTTSFYKLILLPGTTLYNKIIKDGLIKDEEAYLEKISLHGDASHITINLTEMSDEDYTKTVEWADRQVSTLSFLSTLKYWGLIKGLYEFIRYKMKGFQLSYKGQKFETP